MRLLPAVFMALTALQAPPALSADALTDAMQTAYAPYRAALFRTNGKSHPEAELALAQAQQAWQAIEQRFAVQPPAPYDRDAEFAATLSRVSAVYMRADVQVRERQMADAHETLEQVRDLLADLRRRNHVVAYSDAMNAYHAEMEQALQHGPTELAAAQGPMLLMARVGTLDYLARRLRSEAGANLLGDADFMLHLQSVEASVDGLRAAVLSRDQAAMRDALTRLKGPYSRMFLKFG